MVERPEERDITVTINGVPVTVPDRITVLHAIRLHGLAIGVIPGEGHLAAPCGVGGCLNCAVTIDGEMLPSCVTPVREGMEIVTRQSPQFVPRRRVCGWMGHGAGGVGTPWQLKKNRGYIEAAAFTCGCNLRCPQCQNWRTTYNGREPLLTPSEAAVLMTAARSRYGVDRMAISGGESTLNRLWLVSFIRELKRLNPDERARFHVDTNATLLTPGYIDDLVAAGMTDIGPDLKGLFLDTFMAITGIRDGALAERYRNTAWDAVKYLLEHHAGRLFVGIGIPYNRAFISHDEVAAMGEAIARIDPAVQVCVLDYRPAFRRENLQRPTVQEMQEVGQVLKGAGLTTVICQTGRGHIGPV